MLLLYQGNTSKSKNFCLKLLSKIQFQLHSTLLITICDNNVVHIHIDTSLGRMMVAQRMINIISYHYALEELDNISGTIWINPLYRAQLSLCTSYNFHKIFYIQKSLIYHWNFSHQTNPHCRAQLSLCIRRCCDQLSLSVTFHVAM